MTDFPTSTPARKEPLRPYRAPELRRYGRLEDLVQQFSSSPFSDAGANQMAPITPPS